MDDSNSQWRHRKLKTDLNINIQCREDSYWRPRIRNFTIPLTKEKETFRLQNLNGKGISFRFHRKED